MSDYKCPFCKAPRTPANAAYGFVYSCGTLPKLQDISQGEYEQSIQCKDRQIAALQARS